MVVKRCLYEQEWYPVIVVDVPDEPEKAESAIELPGGLAERWDRLYGEWQQLQEELRQFMDAQFKKRSW